MNWTIRAEGRRRTTAALPATPLAVAAGAAALTAVLLSAAAAAAAQVPVAAAQTRAAEAAPAPGHAPEGATAPLTLAEAADAALARHPSVGAARARRDGAEAAVDVARAARLPRVALQGTANRFQEPMVVAPLHGFDPRNAPAFEETLFRSSLTLAYTFFDGGARGARIEGTRARADAATAGLEGARTTLLGSVARAYLRVRSTRDLLDAHDRRLEALERERGRVEKLLDEGRAARVARLRVESAIGRARASRAAAAAEREVAERTLARLMGAESGSVRGRALAPARLRAEAVDAGQPRLVARARAANPDVLAARSELRAAEADRAEARAAWYPRVEIAGGYTQYASGAGHDQGEWQGGVSVSLPLFSGGARLHDGRRAGARADAARNDVRAAELRVADAVDRALAALASARARVEALAAAEAQAAEVARIERLALDAGAGVQTDYLAAEAELLEARAALTEARHARIGARVELARVTGELSREWLAQNLESGT